jgi:putative cardiolipin synthase
VHRVFPLVCCLLAGCASIRLDTSRAADYAPVPAASGPVVEFTVQTANDAPEGDTAFWLLESSRRAFEARIALFDAATTSLDVQYFIWQDDTSGLFLLSRLLDAADRGVRVRLLVDDLSGSGRDDEFYALTAHANVEVRTFNPFRARSPVTQALEFFTRFGTLNHRMHNKTILADGHIGMIGGRNIGDRYFGIYDDFIQHDLDIMFVGEIVDDVGRSFDEYWNAPYSVGLDGYLKPERMKMTLDDLRALLSESLSADLARLSAFETDADAWLQSEAATAMYGFGEYFYDAPDIDSSTQRRMKSDLYDFFASAREELVISTAYFIPDEELISLLERLRSRGVHVVLLTNSVTSNNHMLAHVAYRRSRRRILHAGIDLYELREDARLLAEQSVAGVEPGYVGLHTKAAVVDGRLSMVGTANLDPRALDINTEAAIVLEDAALAADLRQRIMDATSPANAWRLELDSRGRERWVSDTETLASEPVRGPFQRVMQFLHRLLPLKEQA